MIHFCLAPAPNLFNRLPADCLSLPDVKLSSLLSWLCAHAQAEFSYFFDTGGRRRCYIAPERFYVDCARPVGPLTPQMVRVHRKAARLGLSADKGSAQ